MLRMLVLERAQGSNTMFCLVLGWIKRHKRPDAGNQTHKTAWVLHAAHLDSTLASISLSSSHRSKCSNSKDLTQVVTLFVCRPGGVMHAERQWPPGQRLSSLQ